MLIFMRLLYRSFRLQACCACVRAELLRLQDGGNNFLSQTSHCSIYSYERAFAVQNVTLYIEYKYIRNQICI